MKKKTQLSLVNLTIPALYGLAILFSAFLMFLIEPYIGRLLLPTLGGGPNVWNSCVLFFQVTLLAGYLYAHLIARKLPAHYQLLLHLPIVGLPLFYFPIRAPYSVPIGEHPYLWVFYSLTVMIGGVFFAISTTAPLLLKWYAHSKSIGSSDPYFLYAASNFGGIIGLIAYPFIMEPSFSLREQGNFLFGAYVVLALLVTICGITFAIRSGTESDVADNEGVSESGEKQPVPMLSAYLTWIALALIPSSLFLGLTSYVTSELSPIPLFWMMPLFIYLVSFILAFARLPDIVERLFKLLAPIFAFLTVVFMSSDNLPTLFSADSMPMLIGLSLHLATLLLVSTACHLNVAKQRPDRSHLTAYFLCISIGGVLGSCFNSLIAPLLFKSAQEYPVALMTAGICLAPLPVMRVSWLKLTGVAEKLRFKTWTDRPWLAASLVFIVCTIAWSVHTNVIRNTEKSWELGTPHIILETTLELLFRFAIAYLVCLLVSRTVVQYRAGLAVIGCFVLCFALQDLKGVENVVYQSRNFFGRLTINQDREGNYLELWNGLSGHGAESINPALRGIPPCYFYHDGPIGEIVDQLFGKEESFQTQELVEPAVALANQPLDPLDANRNVGTRVKPSQSRQKQSVVKPLHPVAILGLGCGTAAALIKSSQTVDFYEINPDVIEVASNPYYFTYLFKAKKRNVNLKVVSGDGRLEIGKAPYHYYDLIVADVYSSNAVPIHMLTKEAVDTYFGKLTENGVIAFNITNAYYDLRPVLSRLAQEFHISAVAKKEVDRTEGSAEAYIQWVVLSKSKQLINTLKTRGWEELKPPPANFRLWTDDYSNPLATLQHSVW